MKIIEEYVDFYSNHWWLEFKNIKKKDKKRAIAFLQKYWLNEIDLSKSLKIMSNIFINRNNYLPELIFNAQYKILALRGGCLFEEKDFLYMQKCAREVGDNYFVIIENDFGEKIKELPFKLKFPIEITWEEIQSGDFISNILINASHKEYFVFGESSLWGKYSANDYESPLDLFGISAQCLSIFEKYNIQTLNEFEEIKDWVPEKYKRNLIAPKL